MQKIIIGKVKINIDQTKTRLASLKATIALKIEESVEFAAKELLKDCKPYIPLLTGKLRDSGLIQQVENYAFSLIWSATNPANNYNYAARQYSEVFNHVDGRYASEWVKSALDANKGRYISLVNLYFSNELERVLNG